MNFVRSSILLLLWFTLTGFAAPNFIVVIGDDVGWDAFGCTGTASARTPNIDKLAKRSCQMDRFYCSVSQCAPCRAELYTGLLPKHNGVLANAKKEPRPGVRNVIDRLGPLGYRVGLTGKLHFKLGEASFDKIDGFSPNGNGSGQTHSFDGVRGYINKAQADDKPFCVFICSTHAHHPWDHGGEALFPTENLKLRPHYVDTPTTRQAMAKHAAEVEVLDQQVGETLAMMKDMALQEDTIFVFLSEQGIAMPRGKWSPYEHGSRALCLAHWPGKIAPRKTSALAMYCDILPTFLDYADENYPGGEADGLDGRSLKALWSNPDIASHRDAAFLSNVHPFWQKALVTSQYKLVWSGHPARDHIWQNFTSKGKFFSRPWAEWTELAARDEAASEKVQRVLQPGVMELYDVLNDPYETQDLAGQAEHKERIQTMHRELKKWMAAVGEETEPPPVEAAAKKKPRARKRNNQ